MLYFGDLLHHMVDLVLSLPQIGASNDEVLLSEPILHVDVIIRILCGSGKPFLQYITDYVLQFGSTGWPDWDHQGGL